MSSKFLLRKVESELISEAPHHPPRAPGVVVRSLAALLRRECLLPAKSHRGQAGRGQGSPTSLCTAVFPELPNLLFSLSNSDKLVGCPAALMGEWARRGGHVVEEKVRTFPRVGGGSAVPTPRTTVPWPMQAQPLPTFPTPAGQRALPFRSQFLLHPGN